MIDIGNAVQNVIIQRRFESILNVARHHARANKNGTEQRHFDHLRRERQYQDNEERNNRGTARVRFIVLTKCGRRLVDQERAGNGDASARGNGKVAALDRGEQFAFAQVRQVIRSARLHFTVDARFPKQGIRNIRTVRISTVQWLPFHTTYRNERNFIVKNGDQGRNARGIIRQRHAFHDARQAIAKGRNGSGSST
jgi:hypothetical protein